MGGLNGRPFELESCVHGLDPNEVTACANEIADAQPNLHIQGIDFQPTGVTNICRAGLPVLQTVPIFIEDFDTEGISQLKVDVFHHSQQLWNTALKP